MSHEQGQFQGEMRGCGTVGVATVLMKFVCEVWTTRNALIARHVTLFWFVMIDLAADDGDHSVVIYVFSLC